jgi:transmembrane sensor
MSEDRFREETESARRDEARSWVVRLASGRLTVEDAAALRRWHAADPAHARAFAEAKRHWKVLGEATRELGRDTASSMDRPRRGAFAVSRRGMLGAAAIAAAAGIGVIAIRPPFDLWSPLVDFSADYRTGIGEVRTIAIGDSATVQLSTRSRLSLQPDRSDGLHVALLAGEAAIAAGSRPVIVTAGDGETRAVSGAFNVRNDEGIVRATCLAGSLDVSCAGRKIVLHANQQIRYGARDVASPTLADPEEITAWQRGILVFHNQPLRFVIDEVNRYRPGKIVLLNRDLGNRPVAVASFHLDRLDEVISQMEALYGARARHLPAGIVLLS